MLGRRFGLAHQMWFHLYLKCQHGHDTLPFSTIRKHCPDDYPFIVQYLGIVKAQHSGLHVCDSCLGPALLDFAVSCLYSSSFGISLGLDCRMVCCKADVSLFRDIRAFDIFSVSYNHGVCGRIPIVFNYVSWDLPSLSLCKLSQGGQAIWTHQRIPRARTPAWGRWKRRYWELKQSKAEDGLIGRRHKNPMNEMYKEIKRLHHLSGLTIWGCQGKNGRQS